VKDTADTAYARKAARWKQAYADYSFYRNLDWTWDSGTWGHRLPVPPRTWPGTAVPDVIIDHPNRRVIDVRPNVRGEPKLIVELSGDEKDVIIQCRCGDRISLVKLLGIEAVKPIFDGISGRIRGLVENMKLEQPAQPEDIA